MARRVRENGNMLVVADKCCACGRHELREFLDIVDDMDGTIHYVDECVRYSPIGYAPIRSIFFRRTDAELQQVRDLFAGKDEAR